MSNNCEECADPTPRVYMRTSAANGFDGTETEVTVEGGTDDTIDDVERAAEARFDQAVASTDVDHTTPPEYQ